jgi:hypothetical protein
MITPAPQSSAITAGAAGITSIADDRAEGWTAVIAVINPTWTLREGRRRIEAGGYPVWREGRRIVASKAALLAHYRAKAAAALTAPPTGERPPQNKSDARGYLGRRRRRRADREARA